MCVVIQNFVLGWSEEGTAGGEGKTVSRFECTRGAASVSPGACAHLALALILLSAAESRRPPPTASAFSTQKKKAHLTQDHNSPDHIQYDRSACLY